MKIKVCGMTSLEQVQALDAMGVDMAGFIFYRGSKRFVGDKIKAEELKKASLKLQKVGVFVNAGLKEILDNVEAYGLHIVQLHGEESPEVCLKLSAELPVIKALQMQERSSLSLGTYQEVCDYLLLDSGSAASGQYGGTGKHFDWSVLAEMDLQKPWFLSGGIAPEDAPAIRALAEKQNALYALDLNSRFETAPGIKNLKQIEEFIKQLK